jgi:hypothetical protein
MLSQLQCNSAAERIRSIAKSNDLIGKRTRDLPACSRLPEPTTLSTDDIKAAWELVLMASSIDVPASSYYFHIFVCMTSSFLVVSVLRGYFPCSIEPATYRRNSVIVASSRLSSVLLRVRDSPPYIKHGGSIVLQNFNCMSYVVLCSKVIFVFPHTYWTFVSLWFIYSWAFSIYI